MLPHLPMAQRFGEDVHHHDLCGAIDNVDNAVSDSLVDEVKTKVNVLHLSMKLSIFGQGDGQLVITIEHGRCRWTAVL